MIEEVSAQYLKELQAEKEELEKNYSENAHAIKLLQNGKRKSSQPPHHHRILRTFYIDKLVKEAEATANSCE